VVDVVRALGEWANQNKEIIITIAKVVATIAGAGGLLLAVGLLTMAFSSLLSPLYLVVGAIGIIGSAMAIFGGTSKKTAGTIAREGKEVRDLSKRYEELAEKTRKTVDEELELHKITLRLHQIFPDLADDLDGTAESVKKLNGEFGKLSNLELELMSRKLTEKHGKLVEEMKENAKELKRLERKKQLGLFIAPAYKPAAQEAERKQLETDILQAKVDQLHTEQQMKDILREKARLRAFMRGEAPQAQVAPDAAVTGWGNEEQERVAELSAQYIDNLDKRMHMMRIKRIKDEASQAWHEIDARYGYEIEKMREAGATGDAIMHAQRARKMALDNSSREFEKRSNDERRRHAEEQAQSEESLEQQLARARIRSRYSGTELQRRLFQLEKREAIAAALEVSDRAADITRQIFNEREKLLGVGESMADLSIAGTFSAAAVAGLGMGSLDDRIAKATELTAANTAALNQMALNGGYAR